MRKELVQYVVALAGMDSMPKLARQEMSFLDSDEEILEKGFINELMDHGVSVRFLRWAEQAVQSERQLAEARINEALSDLEHPRYNIGNLRRRRVQLIRDGRGRLSNLDIALRWVQSQSAPQPGTVSELQSVEVPNVNVFDTISESDTANQVEDMLGEPPETSTPDDPKDLSWDPT